MLRSGHPVDIVSEHVRSRRLACSSKIKHSGSPHPAMSTCAGRSTRSLRSAVSPRPASALRLAGELPFEEDWKGIRVAHPRLRSLPGPGGRLNPALLVRCALPVLRRWRSSGFDFDVIDAEFFYPDGPAAAHLAAIFDAPFSIKARGSDIHYWGARPECRRQILQAAAAANGLLAVSESLRQDMIAMGMQAEKIRVHYTGVDLDHFRPMDRQTGKAALGVSTRLVVSLGALIPRKGHDIVVNAIANLPRCHIADRGRRTRTFASGETDAFPRSDGARADARRRAAYRVAGDPGGR